MSTDWEERYGPNWRAVLAVMEQARRMSLDEARKLVLGRDGEWVTERDEAWDAARLAARVACRAEAWDEVRDDVWIMANPATRDATSAAVAVCVRDLITDDTFDALYGPWSAVFGDPEVTV